jgi:hypothetical protein
VVVVARPFIFRSSSIGAWSSLTVHFFIFGAPIYFGILFFESFLSFVVGVVSFVLFYHGFHFERTKRTIDQEVCV